MATDDGADVPRTTRGPLDGVLVADFSRVLAGPYATMLLADLGADVVKVEGPAGDDTRSWTPPVREDVSTYYLGVNRGKRSIALDLRDEADVAVARELARRADVLVQNFKPGGLAKYGLDHEVVARHPRARPGAEPADGGVHDPRVGGAHRREVEAEALQAARPEVLDHHVGPAGKLAGEPEVAGVAQVQHHRTLVAVDPQVVGRGLTADGRGPRARLVAVGRLDLDDVRAEVGEQHGRVGAGEHPGEVGDEQARQGTGRVLGHRQILTLR